MKVVVFVKANDSTEAGELPEEKLLTDMAQFNDELNKAGILVGGDGLRPSSDGKRVRFSGEKRSVLDGPFTETKELVAGFWIWNVKSMEEAVEWVKRCPNPTGDESVIEIRPVYEAEDLGEAYTAEARALEEQAFAEAAKRSGSR